MPKIWVWLQLVIGWLPVWALYSTLIVTAHPGTTVHSAVFAGMRAVACAAVLGLGVNRLTQRFPWPVPMHPRFIALHVAAAPLYAIAWMVLAALLESTLLTVHSGGLQLAMRAPLVPFLVMGVWFYVMVAGVTYASQAAQRAAIAEALAVTSRMATLRSQLNPHFLFNALHTVVQLIPLEPHRATQATEQLAGLLRTSLEEDRDLIRLDDEWAFVERYLALERLRFGDRLQVTMDMADDARDALIPSFALQTLVENAVRHGAAPQVEATSLHIQARVDGTTLTVVVHDTGVGADSTALANGGTGLARLRDRLRVLFADRGVLRVDTRSGHGFTATIAVPRNANAERDS
ncbi:MAG: histidine kinase [Gemmatimonadaceae bacterium]|nr:histidine kinase [Gemmatimonadaceae bacterium]